MCILITHRPAQGVYKYTRWHGDAALSSAGETVDQGFRQSVDVDFGLHSSAAG